MARRDAAPPSESRNPPGSAGILSAALGGCGVPPRPAQYPISRAGSPRSQALRGRRPRPQPLRSAQRRRPIGNWNWPLATLPHWQHLPYLHLFREKSPSRRQSVPLSGFCNFVPEFHIEKLAPNRFFFILVPNIHLTLLARNARIFAVARLERVLECFSVAKRNLNRFGDFLTNGRRLSSHVAAGDESGNRRLSANSPDETGRNLSSSRVLLQERARPTPTKSGISASGYALKHGGHGSFPTPGRKRFAFWANGSTTAATP